MSRLRAPDCTRAIIASGNRSCDQTRGSRKSIVLVLGNHRLDDPAGGSDDRTRIATRMPQVDEHGPGTARNLPA